jgi:hypothetical protein
MQPWRWNINCSRSWKMTTKPWLQIQWSIRSIYCWVESRPISAKPSKIGRTNIYIVWEYLFPVILGVSVLLILLAIYTVRVQRAIPKTLKRYPFQGGLISSQVNMNNSIQNTWQGLSKKYLSYWRAQSCDRINRRFSLELVVSVLITFSANLNPIPQHRLRLAEDWL